MIAQSPPGLKRALRTGKEAAGTEQRQRRQAGMTGNPALARSPQPTPAIDTVAPGS